MIEISSQIQVSKSYWRQKKTNIRVYAVKSDDDPKTRIQNLGKTKKTSIRIYAVKSDDDPKLWIHNLGKTKKNQYPGLCRKKRWWSKALNPKPREDQKTSIRVYAVKSDDDPNQKTHYPKPVP